MDATVSPALTLSRRLLICSNGPKARRDKEAARISETRIGNATIDSCLLKKRCDLVFQKYSGYADANAAERHVVQDQRGFHVIYHGRAVDHAHLPAEARVLYQLKLLARSDELPNEIWIAMQDGFAV